MPGMPGIPGTCIDDGIKQANDPYCLGCNKTEFFEIMSVSACPRCARENKVEKLCEPDAERRDSVKDCKKCPATTKWATTTTTTTTTMGNYIRRDAVKDDKGDAASVYSIGHIFLLPIVILILI